MVAFEVGLDDDLGNVVIAMANEIFQAVSIFSDHVPQLYTN